MNLVPTYNELQQTSKGVFLNIRDQSERFEYYLDTLDLINQQTKTFLLELVQSFVPRYGKLNPHALALGFLAVDSSTNTITPQNLKNAIKLLNSETNSRDDKLSTIIADTDIVRYGRLYASIYEKWKVNGMPLEIPDEDDEGEYGDIGDEYSDNDEVPDYGFQQDEEEYF